MSKIIHMKRSNLRNTCSIAVAVLSAALSIPTLGGTNYFVSTNGNNVMNSGLAITSSWRDLSFAVQCVASGDIINVDAGEYIEPIIAVTSPITITGTNLYITTNAPFSRHVSRTIIRPMTTNNPSYPMVVHVRTGGVTLQNLTIDGSLNTDGMPGVNYAIYSTNKPLNVNHCVIRNIDTFGITCYGLVPAVSTNDNDAVRSYFGYNLITNIIGTNLGTATAIMLDRAPSTCEFNEIAQVRGSNSNAGIYMTECKYTTKMTNWVIIRSNYFDYCNTAIWANQFSGSGEKIIIASNYITNGLIGIRVSAAEGQALILSNSVFVSGVSTSTNATPARGIWIQADRDPWGTSNALMQTDHMVLGNTISGRSTNADKTVGILLTYDTQTMTNGNDGVRASILNNSISQFDFGSFISSGTNDIYRPHSPLVRVALHSNDFSGNISYGLYATGMTEMVDASNNWWGYYFGPTGTSGNAVTTNILYSWPLGAFSTDSNGNGTNDWFDTDDDGDGLADTNEIAIGSSPLISNTDGDGMSDLAEFIAGTDPTNSLSEFRVLSVDINTGGSWLEFSWLSAIGRKYNVYRSTNLLTGTFLSVTNNIPAAFPSMNTYTDMTASGSSPFFYRLTVTN